MDDVLTKEQIEIGRRYAGVGSPRMRLIDSHEELRARLESAHTALRAQEDLFEHLRYCATCSEGPLCDVAEPMVRETDELRRVALGAAGGEQEQAGG